MTIHIKNMVCDRCIKVVRDVFNEEAIDLTSLSLGKAETVIELSDDQATKLAGRLRAAGFDLLTDRRDQIVEKVRTVIIELIYSRTHLQHKLSHYISEAMALDYKYISSLFSEQTGSTIEQYYIVQKVERVKELLSYGQQTLSEIAIELHYSSTSHASKQFRKVTGMTPTAFLAQSKHLRTSLDRL